MGTIEDLENYIKENFTQTTPIISCSVADANTAFEMLRDLEIKAGVIGQLIVMTFHCDAVNFLFRSITRLKTLLDERS